MCWNTAELRVLCFSNARNALGPSLPRRAWLAWLAWRAAPAVTLTPAGRGWPGCGVRGGHGAWVSLPRACLAAGPAGPRLDVTERRPRRGPHARAQSATRGPAGAVPAAMAALAAPARELHCTALHCRLHCTVQPAGSLQQGLGHAATPLRPAAYRCRHLHAWPPACCPRRPLDVSSGHQGRIYTGAATERRTSHPLTWQIRLSHGEGNVDTALLHAHRALCLLPCWATLCRVWWTTACR